MTVNPKAVKGRYVPSEHPGVAGTEAHATRPANRLGVSQRPSGLYMLDSLLTNMFVNEQRAPLFAVEG
jgi:hypothetical protein